MTIDAPVKMHPLDRYMGRHADRPDNQIPSEHLLMLSVAQDTHEMLLLARENQDYIRATMDELSKR